MQRRVGKDENEMIRLAWTWLHEEVHVGARVFVPAGGTPQPLYRRWCAEPTALLKSLRLVQIDDILNGPEKGAFARFLREELNPFVSQVEWIENADRTADYAILGVGVNGHVAFHEPGLPRNFSGGCVRLSSETLNYLSLKDPTWGVTYGAAAFLKARKILVMAKGPRKQAILKRAAAGEKTLPITWILEHPNCTLITDFEI